MKKYKIAFNILSTNQMTQVLSYGSLALSEVAMYLGIFRRNKSLLLPASNCKNVNEPMFTYFVEYILFIEYSDFYDMGNEPITVHCSSTTYVMFNKDSSLEIIFYSFRENDEEVL